MAFLDTPESQQAFLDQLISNYSTLTADQRNSLVNNKGLTGPQKTAIWEAELNATMADLEATKGQGKKAFTGALETFMQAAHRLEKQRPEVFGEFVKSNPQWGMRYFAQMGTGNHFVGEDYDPKDYRNLSDALGYSYSQELGYGEDGKQDGKSIASNYDEDRWADVNSESGPGDFWKIGTPSAMKGGVLDFIEDNPERVIAMAASFAMPWLSAQLAPVLGITSTAGQAALTGGGVFLTQYAGGADVDDALLSAVTAGGFDYLRNSADVINAATQVADKFNDVLGTNLTGNELISTGIVAAKGDPAGAGLRLVAGEGMEAFWEANPDLYDTMAASGWKPEAVSEAVIEAARTGGDPVKILQTWYEEGGVGDLPGGDFDIPNPFENLREYTDPLEEWVSNAREFTDPFEEAGQAAWDFGQDVYNQAREATDPIEEGLQNVYDVARDATDPIEALQWPDLPFENPLPDVPMPDVNINTPDINAPDISGEGFNWEGLLPLGALGLMYMQDNKGNNNNVQAPMNVSVAPQDMSYGIQKPDYGTVQQKPLLVDPGGPINDLMALRPRKKEGLL